MRYGVAYWLREAFHGTCEVEHVFDTSLAGAEDEEIFKSAKRRRQIIVTYDEDFADQRVFPVGSHCGILRLRM